MAPPLLQMTDIRYTLGGKPLLDGAIALRAGRRKGVDHLQDRLADAAGLGLAEAARRARRRAEARARGHGLPRNARHLDARPPPVRPAEP